MFARFLLLWICLKFSGRVVCVPYCHLVTLSVFVSRQWTRITRGPSPNGPEPRTRGSRSWSWKRSSTLTGTWPGDGGSRSRTRFVYPRGKSKSGSRTDAWNGRRTTNCPTPRADLPQQQPAICRRSHTLISPRYKSHSGVDCTEKRKKKKTQRLHLCMEHAFYFFCFI